MGYYAMFESDKGATKSVSWIDMKNKCFKVTGNPFVVSAEALGEGVSNHTNLLYTNTVNSFNA
jgi:hypothetical protein